MEPVVLNLSKVKISRFLRHKQGKGIVGKFWNSILINILLIFVTQCKELDKYRYRVRLGQQIAASKTSLDLCSPHDDLLSPSNPSALVQNIQSKSEIRVEI